jgi:hypothetical protein
MIIYIAAALIIGFVLGAIEGRAATGRLCFRSWGEGLAC